MTKSFRVIQPDRQAIDPIRWEIIAPKSDSRDALVVKFGESLDFALAQRLIEIFSSEGDWIDGSKQLEANETELPMALTDTRSHLTEKSVVGRNVTPRPGHA